MPNISFLQKDDDVLHQLYVTMRLFTKTLNDTIKPYEVYSSEWTVLNYLMLYDGVSQADIASALQIEAAGISKTLSKLEKKGLISRIVHGDKREKLISMTAKGRDVFPALAESVAAHRRHALDGLCDDDRRHLLLIMEKIFENLKNPD